MPRFSRQLGLLTLPLLMLTALSPLPAFSQDRPDFRQMTPEQRKAFHEERLKNMTPEQRAQFERFRQMTPEQRRAFFQERLKNMSPEERQKFEERRSRRQGNHHRNNQE